MDGDRRVRETTERQCPLGNKHNDHNVIADYGLHQASDFCSASKTLMAALRCWLQACIEPMRQPVTTKRTKALPVPFELKALKPAGLIILLRMVDLL